MSHNRQAVKPTPLPSWTIVHPDLGFRQGQSASPRADPMLRAYGNQHLQARLQVGPPGDRYEKEADHIADRVMNMSSPVSPQMATPGITPQSNGQVQAKCAACEEERRLQRKPQAGGQHSPSSSTVGTVGVTGAGRPLTKSERGFYEPRFGHDFSQVRIHTGADAQRSAQGLNARAYTLGNNIVFGSGQYAPGSYRGRELMAHELTHTLQQSAGRARIQRAETDDDPRHCFPPGGTPLQDSAPTINAWIRGARSRSRRDAIHMVNAVYQELASGGSVSVVESRLGALPSTHVNHVEYGSSRYSSAMMWPVDPLTRTALWAAGKIFVAPVINLCGTCVGTDKVGHFFQQGYEYFRLYRSVEARIQAMPEAEQRAFYRRIAGPPIALPDMPFDFDMDTEPFGLGEFEVTPAAIVELAASAFVAQFGRWLEGFNNTLSTEDVRWINTHSFIPFYYHEGVYGASTTGVLSRADLQANRMGFQFYQDLWHNPDSPPDICDYVGGLWNEYREVNSVVPGVGSPRGPFSRSRDVETP